MATLRCPQEPSLAARSFSAIIISIATLFLVVGAQLVTLQRCSAEDTHSSSAAGSSKLDVVLLIDSSGSMLSTDPGNLRYEGAELLLQFLDSDDRLAIVSFAGSAHVIRPLSVYEPKEANQVTSTIKGIQTTGAYTDLLEAVKAGQNIFDSEPRDDSQRVMILLSDGKMEPDPANGLPFTRTQDLVSNYLPELRAKEIKVHTLAFSDQADKELLSEIAGASDGLSWFTATAEEIHKSFADLFLTVKRPQVVPLTSRGFRIDDDVQEATFYINHDEGVVVTMQSPKGQAISAADHPEFVQWFNGKQFDVVTVERPEKGDWQAHGVTSNDGFATVLTNLKLITEWPSNARSEEPLLLQARLFESEKPVALPSMSGVIKYAFQISPTDKISEPIIRETLVDDGTSGDRIQQDGVFSKLVTIKEPGEYRLTVVAKGPTFQRSQQLPFRVRPRLITLQVVTQAHGAAKGHGASHGSKAGEHGSEAASGEEHSDETKAADAHGDSGHDEKKDAEADAHETSDAPPESGVVQGNGRSVFRVELSNEATSFKKFEVKLLAKDVNRKKYDLPLKRSLESPLVYEFPAAALPSDGQYYLEAKLSAETKKRQEVEAESRPIKFQRTTSVEDPDVAVKIVAEEEEKPKGEGFPIIQLLIAILGNLGIGAAAFLQVKKGGTSSGPVSEKYTVPQDVSDFIAALEAKASATEVDFEDPILMSTGDEVSIPDAPVAEEAPGEAAEEAAGDGGEE